MKTICIETSPSAAIGWGIRYSDDNIVYTTLPNNVEDSIRIHNLERFQKEVRSIPSRDLADVLLDDNNIQVVTNSGTARILWLYPDPQNHPILSKTWVIDILSSHKLQSYLPISAVLDRKNVDLKIMTDMVKQYFNLWHKVVVKHAWIDGNWNWVSIIDYNTDGGDPRNQIISMLDKFSKNLDGWRRCLFDSDFLIQEYVSDTLWEWSITFSIQNRKIDTLWLSNNVVLWGEYFSSTNIFPDLDKSQIDTIAIQIQKDFMPLLTQLQREWVRWNVGFDVLFQNQSGAIKSYILECNGIHRMTGSLMPNNFAYNTNNDVFVWLPIAQKYLAKQYAWLSYNSLLKLADHLQWFGTQPWKSQIMNIKCEWQDRWHPVVWIASAWASQEQLFQLFFESKITNTEWKNYINWIFQKMMK